MLKLIPWYTVTLLALMAAMADAQPPDGGPPHHAPPPPGTKSYRNLAYVPDGGASRQLDLYVPAGKQHMPLVILIHGGAFMFGSKDDEDVAPLLRAGYAAATINYRLSGEAIFPAQIEDCKAAVRWLRVNAAKYSIDPDRFGVWGHSAGAHLAVMLGTTGDVKQFDVGPNLDVSSKVQAVLDFFGPTDFLQMDAHRLPGGQVHNSPDSPESRLVGGPLLKSKQAVARANPITYITKDAAPTFIAHGDHDLLVPHHQSELLYAALQKAGVPTAFYTVKGGSHGFNDAHADTLGMQWLARYLKAPGSP